MSNRKRMISASGALNILGTALGPPSTNNASLALLWGATGEQEWTPALTTGQFFLRDCVIKCVYLKCKLAYLLLIILSLNIL